MVAFDTDVFTRLTHGDAAILARIMSIAPVDRGLPIVVAEEIVRGRLNSIHQASAGRGSMRIERAYDLLQATLEVLRPLTMLAYSTQAEALFQTWRQQKLRVGTKDLRIGAICIDHGAKLITRNVRDYGQIPGLDLEVW